MLKLSLSALALILMLWGESVQAHPCEESCHVGKLECMKSCAELFKDDNNCKMVCEHADRECMQLADSKTYGKGYRYDAQKVGWLHRSALRR